MSGDISIHPTIAKRLVDQIEVLRLKKCSDCAPSRREARYVETLLVMSVMFASEQGLSTAYCTTSIPTCRGIESARVVFPCQDFLYDGGGMECREADAGGGPGGLS